MPSPVAWPRHRRAIVGDQRGVSLAELAILLVMIAFLAMVAYPLMGNVVSVLTSKGASEQIASGIRQARQYAITRGGRHCIEFQGAPSTRYRIRETDTPGGTSCSGAVVDGWTMVANGAAVTTPSPAPTMVFDPIGNVVTPSAPVSFTIDTQPTSCPSTVVVTRYGGVRVSKC